MRRIVRPELLDTHQATQAEITTSLADLQFINRWFGGIRTSKFLIDRVLKQSGRNHLSILDVGSATGDGPTALKRSFNDVSLNFTLLDRDPSHFNGTASLMPAVAGDATALPFRSGAFDVVTCSLFAHHLEPEQLVQFSSEALRVSRVAFVINDLIRSYLHLGLVYAGMPLYRSRVTRHDTVASVQRAYTQSEMEDILRRTSARNIDFHSTYLCRMGVIAWK